MLTKFYRLKLTTIVLFVALFAIATPANSQIPSRNHGTLERSFGVGSFSYDTGEICVSLGITFCCQGSISAGGDVLAVTENGDVKLNLSTSELYFSGYSNSGEASMNFGAAFDVSCKICFFGSCYNIPIPYIAPRDFLLSDTVNWAPYFPGPYRLSDTFIRQELICAGIDVGFAKGEVCIEGSAAVQQTLDPASIATLRGNFTFNNQRKSVAISCPSYTVSGIRKDWDWSGTFTVSLYVTGRVCILGICYDFPFPIIRNYALPIDRWVNGSFVTVPDRSVTFSPISILDTPSRPSATPNPVCVNSQYCLSWDPVSRATYYEISENNGPWVNVGNTTSKCYTKSSSGSYSYRVRANNSSLSCRSGASGSHTVTVNPAPSAPGPLSASPNPVCVSQQFCISWPPSSGATSYEISENNGSWVNIGNTTSKCYTKSSSGSYCYRVRCINSCGTSGASSTICVMVNPLPGIPGAPIASPNPVCVNTQFCLNWGTVSGASSYEISENNGSWVDIGNTTSKCYTKSDAANYSYRVRAMNSCGAGNASGVVDVSVERCFTISGQAFTENGGNRDPLKSKFIHLFKDPDPLYRIDTTDENGKYYFSSLFRDDYEIRTDNQLLYSIASSDFDNAKDDSLNGYNLNYGANPDGFPTDVEEILSLQLPENYVLYQNYPNPFNPETRIEFSIPRRSFVTIEVFNILGTRVRLLVNENLSAGHKVVTWDSKDENGEVVSSGIYIYRIIADDFVQSKKMMLMK